MQASLTSPERKARLQLRERAQGREHGKDELYLVVRSGDPVSRVNSCKKKHKFTTYLQQSWVQAKMQRSHGESNMLRLFQTFSCTPSHLSVSGSSHEFH